jgi:rare lipoprotein A
LVDAPDARIPRDLSNCLPMTRGPRNLTLKLMLSFVALIMAEAGIAGAAHDAAAQRSESVAKPHAKKHPKQVGKASIYARKFARRRMADGTPMDPAGNNAASKTLPLGTVARVTNLDTGRSATVTIQDRGPYVRGRIVDLSPATAEQIGLTRKEGVAPVEVEPIALPSQARLEVADHTSQRIGQSR